MNNINLIKPEKVNLRNHPVLNEKWVQEIIANDSSILGLGDLILKDKERIQLRAGRLDLLFQDADLERRYEVEIQLGKVDESHIIRTIEYWDNERKSYPQYDHIAVIIAEDITSRFLNVIGLFNSSIPLIAIQMNAFKNGNDYWLQFTTVLNEIRQGLEDEKEEEKTDRNYWERRGTPKTVSMTDSMLSLISEFAPGYELNYTKFYIGLAKDGQSDNFVDFRPRRNYIIMSVKSEQSKEITEKIENSELDLIRYEPRWRKYSIRITEADVRDKKDVLSELFKISYGNRRFGDE